jgi:hypothetical protein
MITCGIEILGRRAVWVFLERTDEGLRDVSGRRTQLVLEDDQDPGAVRAFCRTAHAWLDEGGPERVGILQRKKAGTFAAGGTTFKIEGLIQLYPALPVEIVAPQSLRAFAKETAPRLAPRFKYQAQAWLLALLLLASGEAEAH